MWLPCQVHCRRLPKQRRWVRYSQLDSASHDHTFSSSCEYSAAYVASAFAGSYRAWNFFVATWRLTPAMSSTEHGTRHSSCAYRLSVPPPSAGMHRNACTFRCSPWQNSQVWDSRALLYDLGHRRSLSAGGALSSLISVRCACCLHKSRNFFRDGQIFLCAVFVSFARGQYCLTASLGGFWSVLLT